MNAIKFFEKGKRNIVLIVVLVSVAGYLAEIFSNRLTYPIGQVILDLSTCALLVTSYIFYFRNKQKKSIFLVISYGIIANILISHWFFYVKLDEIRAYLFIRDSWTMITLIAATGFIVSRRQILLQTLAYVILLAYYVIIEPAAYIVSNFSFFIVISAGSAAIFYFIVKVVQNFINSLTESQSELSQKNDSITSSLHYARRIQRSILPSEDQLNQLFPGSFVFYKPKDIVSGDFFFTHRERDLLFFAVADCTGHGIPGAFVSFVCHNSLRSAIHDYKLRDPGQILDKTRELILKRFNSDSHALNDGMNIALCTFDLNTSRMTYSGAYNDLLIINEDGVQTLRGDRQPVGVHTQMKSFKSYSIQVAEGDWVYLYSDGFTDQFGGKQSKKFKEAPFRELIQSLSSTRGSEQKVTLERVLDEWKGTEEQVDDITVMGIRIPAISKTDIGTISQAS